MATYLILNIIFILVVVSLLACFRTLKLDRNSLYIGLILIILTAIFDSLIVASGIVAYNENKILGIYIFKAPIEDFFYSILATIIVPSIWKLTGRLKNEGKS